MGAIETTDKGVNPHQEERRHEVSGILVLAFTLLISLSLLSFELNAQGNLIGPVGYGVADLLTKIFGVAAWWIPLELALTTSRLFRRLPANAGTASMLAGPALVLLGCALVHLSMSGETVFGGQLPGGKLGEYLGELLCSFFGLAGAYVLTFALILVTLVLRTPISVSRSSAAAADWVSRVIRSAWDSTCCIIFFLVVYL